MQIEVKIEPREKETKVIIVTPRMDESVSELMKRISGECPQVIAGFSEDTVCLLDQEEIYRVYAGEGRVYCETRSGTWRSRLRLYELEERLEKSRFVRISNSEIINLKRVKGFDLSLSGTIRVSLTNGAVTYVSRRYMGKIKKVLGL
ncbi:MAG: LytTR family transcriptional regulator [Oscillospiraceae bacterium]|nr:LytTR family transcriptional regulator [Oscillospiraceae bacterium]